MFTVHSSNRTERLLDQVLQLLETQPLRQPLRAEQILIQSPGMATWLKLRIAERLDVAANIEFPLPAAFFWNLFSAVMLELPEQSPFDREVLTWRLMGLLPERLEDPLFKPLKNYLQHDSDSLLYYQVSRKIADLLDSYLIYRPDWILAWQAGEPVEELAENAHATWQASLWQALCADDQDPPRHRISVQQRFVAMLEAGEVPPEILPERIIIFGISALPPQHLDLMMTLASHTDVHLMMLNPCKYYWGDVPGSWVQHKLIDRLKPGAAVPIEAGAVDYYLEGCPLLASWGKVGRDYQSQIYAYNEVQENPQDLFMSPRSKGLLGRVQRDILYLRQSGGEAVTLERLLSSRHKQVLEPDDQSLRIARAHSPMREVEALYDYLLGLFNNRRLGLRPRDVVVMMPDINRFAPFIQAVFGTAPKERYIPFSIADQSRQAENPIVTALRSLLSLPLSRLGRSEILDILEVPAIMHRFQITEDDLPLIRRWLEEAGVRWGLDGEHRAQAVAEMPLLGDFNTWSRGLERLLLGYAVGEVETLLGDALPYGAVEGSKAPLVGALCEFLALLRETLAQSRQARSLGEWISFGQSLLQHCFHFEGVEENTLQFQLVQALEAVQQQAELARFHEPVTLTVFRSAWLGELELQDSSARFLSGKVNFCTLMPMRSIPFRVVCLLGMNDGEYPRIVPRLSFDLMAAAPRRGDRTPREDDRYLFLEALVSARDFAYLSYEGRDARENSERMPSVLVSELLEYVEQGFCLAGDEDLTAEQSARRMRDWLVIEHRLQPFHASYYRSDSAQATFVEDWLPLVRSRPEKNVSPLAPLPLPDDQAAELELETLLQFFDNPCKAFLQERLEIRFLRPQEQLPDVEPFELDGLQRYRLRTAFLTSLMQGYTEDAVIHRWQACGELPPGAQGQRLLERETDSARALYNKLQELTTQPREDCLLDCEVAGHRIRHRFRDLYEPGRVELTPSRLRGKHLFRAWISHVFYSLTDHSTQFDDLFSQARSWLLGFEGDRAVAHWFQPLSAEQALGYGEDLVRAYRMGLEQPLAFLPGAAWAWAEAREDQRDRKAALVFTGNPFQSLAGEGEDAYVQRLYPNWERIQPGLAEWARRLVMPALAALVREEAEHG